MDNLEVLDAYNNNFTALLPLGVLTLKKLRYWDLGGNFFYGTIPESYGDLVGLQYLSFAKNDLSGKIPGALGNLSNLKEIYLGYFKLFEGGIPMEFGNLVNLVHRSPSSSSSTESFFFFTEHTIFIFSFSFDLQQLARKGRCAVENEHLHLLLYMLSFNLLKAGNKQVDCLTPVGGSRRFENRRIHTVYCHFHRFWRQLGWRRESWSSSEEKNQSSKLHGNCHDHHIEGGNVIERLVFLFYFGRL
ncbi:hypothetical protein QN277_014427 [Acacia crassicarpa]|uniref:Uncharacterized protein n=1 Tax=Acacia crassicarpa TaxID=499986 RepID=A0AAE1M7V5_9FABA|nr:hypothetical protein QN277_014427 [Acacia crassicarpa]